MRVFSNPKGIEYSLLINEYETYLPEYFGKLSEAYKDYPIAKDNPEYMIYVNYNKWPIRKLEYSYVIGEMKKAIFKNAKVLDAGCGVSSMPFLWANLGGDVTAVDFDEKSINLMKRFNDDNYFEINKKITLEVCDIMKLPYLDCTFDIVTTTSVIEHLPYPNYILAINELYRVLKPEGTLVCTCDIKAEKESKRNAVGAFSIEDIKKILSCFCDELSEESKVFDNLMITEEEIEKFWNSHYYEGIGYKGNRQYVAIGFSLNKKNNEDKKQKLLPYNHTINELIKYQNRVQTLLNEIEIKKEFIIEIENDSNNRLKDIEKLTSMVRELDKEAKDRLNNINILTDIVERKDNERAQMQIRIDNLSFQYTKAEEENKKLEQEYSSLKQENETLTKEKSNLINFNKNLSERLENILNYKIIKFLRKIKYIK